MSDKDKTYRVQEGFQPRNDELSKVYRVTQPVDLANLKIPKNMGDAAVTPVNHGTPVVTPAKSEKAG